jgi:hypothetical protein
MGDNIQPVTVGQSVVLSLGANPEGLTVRITPRTVEAARETPLQKFIYTPRIWASTVAGLCVVVLLGTAFASGTIRPTPPPLPTRAPGEPTPTPDTRPRLLLSGFQLVAPEAPPTATPQPRISDRGPGQTPAGVATLTLFEPTPTVDPPPVDDAASQSPICNQFIRFGCPAPRPVTTQPGRTQSEVAPTPGGVVPGPSPVPGGAVQDRALGLHRIAPPPGSNLDDALRAASVVDKNFNKALSTDLGAAGLEPVAPAEDSNKGSAGASSTDSSGH